jgi:RNA 3'-terminal phosphate cyclase-like protein
LFVFLLSGPIEFRSLHSTSVPPGIRDYELSFLRLLEQITNGSRIQISRTATRVKFDPGLLIGGGLTTLTHNCPSSRSIGYFIEGIMILAPFCKRSLEVILHGITNDNTDCSVDSLRSIGLPMLEKFGFEEKIQLKVKKRGFPPLGGGEVYLFIPVVKALKPIHMVDPGLIKRVRGLCCTAKCNPALANRVIDSARAVLNQLLPDVFIYSDHFKGSDAGQSPGYAICMVAESTTGALLMSELTSSSSLSPEQLGRKVAEELLNQVEHGGFVDEFHQSIILVLMAIANDDVSKIKIGTLTEASVEALRLIEQFFGIQFKFKTNTEEKTVVCSVIGAGVKNITRKAA